MNLGYQLERRHGRQTVENSEYEAENDSAGRRSRAVDSVVAVVQLDGQWRVDGDRVVGEVLQRYVAACNAY